QFGSANGTTQTAITLDTKLSKVVLPVVGGYLAAHDSGGFAADLIAPVLHLPDPITVDATSPAGAIVAYTATATDNEDPDPSLSCVPASGSTFPIGDTTVNCTATDVSGNATSGSFTVHVKSALEELGDLLASATNAGPGPSLAAKVKAIQNKVAA